MRQAIFYFRIRTQNDLSRLPVCNYFLKTVFPTKTFSAKIVSLVPRLPLASSCLRTMRQKLSAASRLPLRGRLLAKQDGEGLLHFRFKMLNNSAIPFPISPLAFTSCQVLLAQNLAKKIQPFKRLNLSGILAELPFKGNLGK